MDAALDDRMKFYEQQESKRLMPLLPACARLDGKSFHSFCSGLARPYDVRLATLMMDVTEFLVQETCANIGYTQSDEITLIWNATDYRSQIFMDGRIHKMVSILAALASSRFNFFLPTRIPEKQHLMPVFDCRVWNVPNLEEAANLLLWRESDATKNSISMAARTVFSHNELLNKHGNEMQEMLWQKGINWNDYPDFFKRGTYFARKTVTRAYTGEELEKLPLKHEARTNPYLAVTRTDIQKLELPPMYQIENRVDFLFGG